MRVQTVCGVAAIVCVSLSGLVSTLLTFEIVNKVNEKLLETEKFEYFGWHFAKHVRLNREYRRLYPNGKLVQRLYILMALIVFSLVVAAWCLLPFTS